MMEDGFVWSRALPLSHPAIPAITALTYLAACAAHNTWRLPSRAEQAAERAAKSVLATRKLLLTGPLIRASTPWLDTVAVLHNALLVGFSTLVCACSSRYFALVIWEHGLRSFLCPPPTGHPCSGTPLRGPLFWWCYTFYASKYYELVDTLLLMLRCKRVILLHAFHHALMPLVMWLLFEYGCGMPLMGLATMNAFVHVVMYGYYLAAAMRLDPPLWWKRRITALQLFQFCFGGCGAVYFWSHYFAPPRAWVGLGAAWPPLQYVPGCAATGLTRHCSQQSTRPPIEGLWACLCGEPPAAWKAKRGRSVACAPWLALR